MDFFSALSLYAPDAHLLVKGEFDASAAAELRPRLDEAVDSGCIRFAVDASAVVFVDAGALGALVRLRNTVAAYGGSVTVTAASPRFRQVAGLAGLLSVFDLDLLPALPTERTGAGPVSAGQRRRQQPVRRTLVQARTHRTTELRAVSGG